MDKVGEAINWSAVAQRAFLEAALAQAVKKEQPDMSSVVERLRASKERVEKRDRDYGHQQGRRWAEQEAEYDELKRVAEIDTGKNEELTEGVLQMAIDPEDEFSRGDWTDFILRCGLSQSPSEASIEGFIDGATEVFDAVDAEL
jgi:hypothetical protein